MIRLLLALIAAGVMSAFAALLLHGQYFAEGPVVVSLTTNHGIHRGDVLVSLGWLIGIIALAGMLADGRRRDSLRP
jgi:hypothetical protein